MKKLGILLIALFVVSLAAAPAFAQTYVHVRLYGSPITVGAFGGVALNGGVGVVGQTGFQDVASTNVSSTRTGIVQFGVGNGDPTLTTHGSSVGVLVTNPIIINNSSSSRAIGNINVIANSF
jgi:hypothetical protein